MWVWSVWLAGRWWPLGAAPMSTPDYALRALDSVYESTWRWRWAGAPCLVYLKREAPTYAPVIVAGGTGSPDLPCIAWAMP